MTWAILAFRVAGPVRGKDHPLWQFRAIWPKAPHLMHWPAERLVACISFGTNTLALLVGFQSIESVPSVVGGRFR